MSKTVLIADDSLTIRKVVELTFLSDDWEVESSSQAAEAADRLAAGGVDVLIVDVHLPDGDGYTLCENAKEAEPDRPVVLLVGTFEPFDEERSEECGADAVVRKPFDSQELHKLVHGLVHGESGELEGEVGSSEASEDEPAAAPVEAAEDDAGSAATGERARTDWPPVPPHTDEPVDGDDEGESTRPGILSPSEKEIEEQPEPTSPVEAEAPAEPTAVTGLEDAPVAGERAAAEPGPSEAPSEATPDRLPEAELERIARRVVQLISIEEIRRVAWEVVPDLAEVVVRERLEELEGQLEEA